MAERSFKRAALFGCLGALIFLVIGVILCEVFPSLKQFVLFKTQNLTADLIVIAITVRFNLFVVIGFIAGWAYCLFRGTRVWRERKRTETTQ